MTRQHRRPLRVKSRANLHCKDRDHCWPGAVSARGGGGRVALIQIERQLDLFLMSLPRCGRGLSGRCEAVTESSAAGTRLRCLTCNCVAPYPAKAHKNVV
jgi:hypothetical protein